MPETEPLDPVALRKAHGLSENAAAKALGIDRESLRRYEGKRRDPPSRVVVRMAELYGVAQARAWGLALWWSK